MLQINFKQTIFKIHGFSTYHWTLPYYFQLLNMKKIQRRIYFWAQTTLHCIPIILLTSRCIVSGLRQKESQRSRQNRLGVAWKSRQKNKRNPRSLMTVLKNQSPARRGCRQSKFCSWSTKYGSFSRLQF